MCAFHNDEFLGKDRKKVDEVSVDTCLIVDTITITELYIENYVSIVTHYTSGRGITFIAIVQHCVLYVLCLVLMLFCLSISESKH